MIGAMIPLPAIHGMTDEEKKQAFLKTREEMQTVEEPAPQGEPAPKPKPRPAPHHRPAPSPTPARHKLGTEEKATPRPSPGTKGDNVKQPREEREKSTPVPTRTPLAAPAPAPTPAPTPPPGAAPAEARAPVIIQKEGLANEPEPPPPPEPRGWWPWSRPAKYRYLTRSVIEALRRAPVIRGRWRYIVVHNSGTRQGNAKIFDYYHRHTRRMPNGLAYHFVIGNGTSSGDGEIEIGDRWRRQINGGHVHSDFLNSIALGICLVGDFNRDTPTKKQLAALDELIRYLRQRVGKFEGHVAVVKAHKEINPVPTDCPGSRFPYHWLHGRFD